MEEECLWKIKVPTTHLVRSRRLRMDKELRKVMRKKIRESRNNIKLIVKMIPYADKLKSPYVQVRFNDFITNEIIIHANIARTLEKELKKNGGEE